MNATHRAVPALLALALALAACGRTPGGSGPPARTTWTMKDVQKSWQADPADTTKEVWVSFHYPEFTAAPGPAAVDSLNEWVRVRLLRSAPGDTVPASLDAMAASLIEDYREFRTRNPESRLTGWFFEGEVAVTWDTLGVVSLNAVSDGYTGGAHGFSVRTLAMFDARNGRRLRVDDLIAPGSRDSLERLAEAAFRAARHLAPDTPLDEEGFRFEGGRFRLNGNAGIDREGLTFFYNEYEVAPHSMGTTEARIGWSDLRPLLRTDGPLASLARR